MVKAISDSGEKTTGKFKPLNIAEIADGFSRLYLPKLPADALWREGKIWAEPLKFKLTSVF